MSQQQPPATLHSGAAPTLPATPVKKLPWSQQEGVSAEFGSHTFPPVLPKKAGSGSSQTSVSRQLSEENANLQESVEKESTEKKRLSRNNEELLWRLQTSPLMSPASSPLHRSFSTSPLPSSPLFSSSPVAGCDSPTHCHGCPQQAQYSSPSHRAAATNQNFSPGPATPTHRAVNNQNYSPTHATPTHRASASCCNSNTSLSSLPR